MGTVKKKSAIGAEERQIDAGNVSNFEILKKSAEVLIRLERCNSEKELGAQSYDSETLVESQSVNRDGGRCYSYTLFVDSRTTNSGATLRWLGMISCFSRTALMPSNTTPTAEAPMVSIGWRTVVSDGV